MKRRFLWYGVVLTTFMVVPAGSLAAQDAPLANPDDVGSVDAIMRAVYDVISGPAGPRDWDRFRSLFYPGAQLTPIGRSRDTGGISATRTSVDAYATNAGRYFLEQPFFEVEVNRVTERYGNLAHAFSTYESRRSPEEEPFVRGINSFQLLFDGSRWWVMNILWVDENTAGPIPTKYVTVQN